MKLFSRWLAGTLALLFALLALAGGTVAVIDPFFHYHAPLPGLSYPINNNSYQTPGIAHSYVYDSIILGSSVTFDFASSYFNQLMGLSPVKLSHSGGNMVTLAKSAQVAFSSPNTIKTVFYSLDHWALEEDPSILPNALPEYLYDDNPFNDLQYLFNSEVLFGETLQVLINTAKGVPAATMDTAFAESSAFYSGESITLAQFQKKLDTLGAPSAYNSEQALANANNNLLVNLIPFIEAHPDTTFVVFIPPASILYWYEWIISKDLDTAFALLDEVYNQLLDYPNVQLFNFLDVENVVLDLYNYYDEFHYSARIHQWMTECFASGAMGITAENRDERQQNLRRMVESFNFDIFYGDVYPFRSLTDPEAWADCFAGDSRYTLLLAASGEQTPAPEATTLLSRLGLLPADAALLQNAVAQKGGPYTSAAISQQYTGQLGGHRLILSAGEGTVSVDINVVEYAQRLPGYNIVVWDTQLGRVADSVSLPYEGGTLQRRISPV